MEKRTVIHIIRFIHIFLFFIISLFNHLFTGEVILINNKNEVIKPSPKMANTG